MSKKCLYTSLISVTILFLLLSFGALFLFMKIDYFIDEQVKKQAPFVNGSKPFEKWSNPAEDTEFKYTLYLFNVTNPEAVQEGREKPHVRQLGPYEYLQNKTFTIYDWDSDENLLNFKMKRVFYRDETCKGNLNDTVTILNVPLISFASLIKNKTSNLNIAEKFAVSLFMKSRLKSYDLFVTQKVGDILFNGYKDELTASLAKFEVFIKKIQKFLHIKIDGPSAISENGFFSLLGQKNNTDFGLWTIRTGKDDLSQLGKLVYLDGKKNLTCWTGNCSSIDGTDGMVHHPFIKNSDILSVFEPELNRTVFLNFERDTSYKGITTKRFQLSNLTYASPDGNEYNQCFCPDVDPIRDYNGTLRVAHCNLEVPLVFSNPHFLFADSYFSREISGFNPVQAEHESFAEVTEKLGIVINGRKTVQLNIDTEAYRYFLDGSKRFIFPVFWLSDSGAAGPSSVVELKAELYDKVENIKKYLIIFIAIFIAGWVVPAIYLLVDVYTHWFTDDDGRWILDNDDSNQEEEARHDDLASHETAQIEPPAVHV